MSVDVSYSSSSTSSSSSSSTDFEEVASINQLPFDIVYKIFSMLPDIDRARAREVCHEWKGWIENIEEMEQIKLSNPHVTVYGKKAWEKYFGYVVEGEVPKPPPRIIREVELMRCQLKGVDKVEEMRCQLKGEGEAPACALILLPKGLTFNKLRLLIENEHLKESNRTSIRYIWEKTVKEHGDRAIDESYWVLITEDVIEESRGKGYDKQKALIEERTKSQWVLPGFIEVVACVALRRAKTGERLFGDHPWTYTRCKELLDERWSVVVGGFSSSGLYVASASMSATSCGVAPCRKF